jgi:hypothetical protein
MIKCICTNCKKEYLAYPSSIKKWNKNFCSKKCYFEYRNTNEYIIENEITKIIIHSLKYGDKTILIDTEDLERIKKFSWCVYFDKKMNDFYFLAYVTHIGRTRKSISLHRYILNAPPNTIVDHINTKNRLDNRKSNLRVVNQIVNMRNQNELKFKNKIIGVYYNKRDKKWIANITINKNKKILGRFINFEDAVKCRKQAELEYWGENLIKNSGLKEDEDWEEKYKEMLKSER